MNHQHNAASTKVDFRFRDHEKQYAKQLAEEAQKTGRSIGEQAREMIKDGLSRPDQLEHAIENLQQEVAQLFKVLHDLPSIKEGLRSVHENIYEFRDDILRCTIKILTDAGKLTPQAADEWAKKTFGAE